MSQCFEIMTTLRMRYYNYHPNQIKVEMMMDAMTTFGCDVCLSKFLFEGIESNPIQ